MKPIIKIILVCAIVAIIGLIIYFVWSALAPTPQIPAPQTSNPNLPIVPGNGGGQENSGSASSSQGSAAGTPVKISENPVFDYWIDPQTKEIYYLNPEGQVFSAKDGEDLEITQQKLPAPNSIQVSPNGQRVLAAFGDPRAPQWGAFDVIDGTWQPLPSDILAAAWGKDGNTLTATVKNGSFINLSSVNLSQNPVSYKTIVSDFRFQDAKFSFQSPNNLIISEVPSAYYPSRIWNFSMTDKSFNLLFSPENGLTEKTSSDGNLMFVDSTDGGFRILNTQTLGIAVPIPFSTFPSKCSPDSSVIYCFVPRESDAFSKAVLPDDYLTGDLKTDDLLYKIDVSSDDAEPIEITGSAGAIDAKNPQVTGGVLYFINRYDDGLYSLKLAS